MRVFDAGYLCSVSALLCKWACFVGVICLSA